MAFKTGHPKYAMDGDRLIGLNLADTQLDDPKWQQVVALLQREGVRLQALNISDNQVTSFLPPPGIEALQRLDVSDNPLTHPPKQIVEAGSAAVLNFFQQIAEQEGTVPLYEAKLLIVGQPGAGKTTLQKILADPNYEVPPGGDEQVKSTVGVNILEGWPFPHRVEGQDITFKANLWDFGGQMIQYMTHHFFLTPRALYVLVADDRKQNTEFDYWFRILDLLGREDAEEKISVLVVLNEINHVAVSNFNLPKYREDYPGMDIHMWEVDFSKRDSRLRGLPGRIQELLIHLPHIGDPLPRLWIPIREALFERRRQQPHITFAAFADICSCDRDGRSLSDEADQRLLSTYLHRLGVMLHYQDDLYLDDFVILRPQWAVDAVYSILKDKQVQKNHGRFTVEDLRKLLHDYQSEERRQLLSLMLKDKFEICYPTNRSGEYIAPHLLPSAQPAYEWDSTQTMKFRYQYPFLPVGLISRLIVRLSDDIAAGGACVWATGVVIERGGCRARIIQEKTVREGLEILAIELEGTELQRKYLLGHIMAEIEKIHEKSFAHIAFEKMIPCHCDPCREAETPTFFEFSKLEQYVEEGWDQIDCPKGKLKKVSVKGLLSGVFQPVETEKGEQHFRLYLADADALARIDATTTRTEQNTRDVLNNQQILQNHLAVLLHYAGEHRREVDHIFRQLENNRHAQAELQRINTFLTHKLSQLPNTGQIVQAWREATAKLPDDVDVKWKLKFKIPFLLGSLEKELALDGKAMLRSIREEWLAYARGERSLKELFVEDKA